ncbi:aldo/keto reductase [Bacillus solimangrovi]|uniref:Oxidoreductase n=1 Tax=Bacillus solimangrovi TaxID=1305675 RepID=A0A1E5LH40_9BACI|nr:aldo/keto reductase [Bacillus solimangrovi]OEH93366.1 oxidoreductase [Bacillus solimangrovi]
MERVKLSETLEVSRIVHGHWRLNDWNISNEEILTLIEQTRELGITTIDHADIYGSYTCEEQFGQALALKPSLRSELELITKCGIKLISDNRPSHNIKHYDTSKEHIIHSVETSLKSFRTDYIDLLLIHRPDFYMNPEEVAETFAMLKQQGKVLNFGVSNFSPSQFSMLDSYLDFPLVTNQIEISPLFLDYFMNGGIDQCLERRFSPMAWSPLAGGNLFSSTDERAVRVRTALEKVRDEVGAHSIDEVAYAWLLNHPAKIIPVFGSSKLDRINSAVNAMSIRLSNEQWYKIWISSTGKDVA